MHKDFDSWSKEKKRIHKEEINRQYHAREIWWCSLGVNIGFEQDGTGEKHERPILIMKGLSSHTCLVIPLTTSQKMHKMRIPIGQVDDKQAFVVLSQMRVIETKRLTNKLGFLSRSHFQTIRKAVRMWF